MDYLKFNCYDLASQNEELRAISKKLQSLYDGLIFIFDTLEPQINIYDEIQNTMATSKRNIADFIVQISKENINLDEIVDLYYAAEKKAIDMSEELPIGINSLMRGNLAKLDSELNITSKVITSTINNGNLVLEDWLAALIYRNQ